MTIDYTESESPSGAVTFTPVPGDVAPPMPSGPLALFGTTYDVLGDDFEGTALNPSNFYAFESASPGAGAVDDKGAPIFVWPGPTAAPQLMTVSNSTLSLYAAALGNKNANGNAVLSGSGVGSTTARALSGPHAVLCCFRRPNVTPNLDDYQLEWPQSNANWPRDQEDDDRETNGAGLSRQTIHGSAFGNDNNIAVGLLPSSYDATLWTVGLYVVAASGVSVYYGRAVDSLALASQITAAEVTAAGIEAPAGGAIDLTAHVFDIAVELEGVTSIPAGFTATPTLIEQVAWVCWLTPAAA